MEHYIVGTPVDLVSRFEEAIGVERIKKLSAYERIELLFNFLHTKGYKFHSMPSPVNIVIFERIDYAS